MTVHKLENLQEFRDALANKDGQHPVVLLDCYAEWCGPCKAISPIVARLSDEPQFEKILFAKFDVDKVPDLAQELSIRAMPTFIIFKDGEKVDDFLGANPEALLKLITAYAPN